MTFDGFIRDGFGSAARDVLNGVYPSHLLGFDPYPGTLNLAVNRGTPATFGPADTVLDGPECPLWLWKGHTRTVDVWVMWPDRHPPREQSTLVEILAPVQLHTRTGDRVTVTI